jgi:hypothetical protein
MKLEVITFNDCKTIQPDKGSMVITVSKANNWMKGLSPFILGPCPLYGNYISKNMENAWQFSKVYPEFLSGTEIKPEYFEWAEKGWSDPKAYRYPMGKGRIPKFSYWDGEHLSYVEARKRIYIPVYYRAVKDTEAFEYLQALYNDHREKDKNLYLIDFDAYRHKELGWTYEEVINCPTKKMGHAFILAMALEDKKELAKYV